MTFVITISFGTNERKFVAFTGEMGMREVRQRVLKDKISSFTTVDTKFISLASGQALVLGGQFVTYRMTNGIELKQLSTSRFMTTLFIIVNCTLLLANHLESYRFTFLDLE